MISVESWRVELVGLATRIEKTLTADRSGGLSPITWVRQTADRVNRMNGSSTELDLQLKRDLEALGFDPDPPTLPEKALLAPLSAAVWVLERMGFR